MNKLMESKNITDIEELEDEDIEEEMEKILCKVILKPSVRCVETTAYPRILTEFL